MTLQTLEAQASLLDEIDFALNTTDPKDAVADKLQKYHLIENLFPAITRLNRVAIEGLQS